MSLFAELRRRNVFRVALAYLALAWIVTEVANTLFPAFGIPDWAFRFLVIVIALGFVPTFIFSWAYELTPEGLKRDKDVVREESITPVTAKRLDKITIGLVLFAVAFVLADRLWLPSTDSGGSAPELSEYETSPAGNPQPDAPANSIAVLPFVNMSSDPEQEFFSDGMTEEILNVLVRIKGLQVTGRTSSFQFKGKNLDLRDIGAQLGVNHILEGSVRRFGDELRITAQLVRADNGFHLWSETYERRLDNVFEIQEDIAQAIADALKIPLGLESDLLGAQTRDLVAYDLYLKGISAYKRRGKALAGGLEALTEAIQRDPEFAAAWAGLALIEAVYFYYHRDLTASEIEGHFRAGQTAAERAIEIQPDNARAFVALGAIFKERLQWADADRAFRRSLGLDPLLSDAHQQYAEFLIGVGYSDRAEEHARKAVELDPLVPIFQNILGYILSANERYTEAEYHLKQSIAMDPGLPQPHNNLRDLYAVQGKIEAARKVIMEHSNLSPAYRELSLRVLDARSDPSMQAGVLAELIPQADYNLMALLGDLGAVLDAVVDGSKTRGNSFLAFEGMRRMTADPRFKISVQRYQLDGFWRQNDWPGFCRPLGDDDFECGDFDRSSP